MGSGRRLWIVIAVLALANLALLPRYTRRGGAQVAPWLLVGPSHKTMPPADGRPFVDEGVAVPGASVMNAEVVRLPDGRWRKLYHTEDQRVLSAISSDGRHFSAEEGVRFKGAITATVRLDDGRYRTYYVERPGGAFVSAISRDLWTFEREPGERLSRGPMGSPDDLGTIHPCVLRLPDGRWRMYYDGMSPNPGADDEKEHMIWTTLSATSNDGLTFVKEAGVRLPTERYLAGGGKLMAEWSCDVHLEKGTYVMYVGAWCHPASEGGIYRATSSDGLEFVLEPQPVIGIPSSRRAAADRDAKEVERCLPQDPFVLAMPDGERLFYWTSEDGVRSAWRGKGG